MANRDLKMKPQNIDKDSWFYEEAGGIEIHKDYPGEPIPHLVLKIPWSKLRGAVAHKDK